MAVVWLLLAAAGFGQATLNVLVRAAMVSDHLTVKPVPMLAVQIAPAGGGVASVVTTGFNGRAHIALRPGVYTVTTPKAVVYAGARYRWGITVAVSAAKPEIDLSNINAERTDLPQAAKAPERRTQRIARLNAAQRSVVTVWSDWGKGRGFLVGSDGLVVTADDVIAGASYVAVQFDAQHQVRAAVLAADPLHDIAVLRVNLQAYPDAKPATLAWPAPSKVDLHDQKHESGAPVFNQAGDVVGMSTYVNRLAGVVNTPQIWTVMQKARAALAQDAAPSPAFLPVAPAAAYPVDVLQDDLRRGALNLKPYTFGEGPFQVLLVTPPLAAWLGAHPGRLPTRHRPKDALAESALRAWLRDNDAEAATIEIVAMPKQGVTKWSRVDHFMEPRLLAEHVHFKTAFARMELHCGSSMVTPIEPQKLEAGGATAGVYSYTPAAFGPACASMQLTLHGLSGKTTTKKLSPELVRRIWGDFAPWRAAGGGGDR